MLIQPDTYIRLIRNCPLDNKYEHTIYFSSPNEQELHFKSLSGIPYTKQSYQRYSNGVITLKDTMNNVYNCNYLMFKNTAFENKWFYAFINKVEYVNNVTCRVYYELDVMQTWMFDYTLGDCFVEREHSITDNVGDNLIHEDVYFGPYVYGKIETPKTTSGLTMEDLSVVIMYNPSLLNIVEKVPNVANFLYEKQFYGGVYQGVNFIAIPVNENNISLLNDIIKDIDFLTFGGFLSAFIMPTMFLPTNRSGYNEYNPSVIFSLSRNTDFGGYEPKNNKLFTYPYTCANLTSNRSSGNDFAFEHFAGGVATFSATGNLSSNPSSMAYPLGYKGYGVYTEGAVSIASYPVCTWGSDGVTEWINNNLLKSLATVGTVAALSTISPATALAGGASSVSSILNTPQNQLSLPAGSGGAVAGLLNPGTNPMLPNMDISGFTNALNTAFTSGLTSTVGSLAAIGMARSEFDPGSVHGPVEGDIFMGIMGGRDITARVKHITPYYAKIVDEYFTRFGYATMQVKKPNISSRPHWNYIKTCGCVILSGKENSQGVIDGGLPSRDLALIKGIYDRGITFWKKDSKFGDYSQNNKPTGV